MIIKEERHEEYVSLTPVGDLDANSSVELDEKILEMLKDGDNRIHIDGSEIDYISSAGLGVFVSHLEEIKQTGGNMILSNLRDSVKDVFVLLGLDQLLTIVADQEAANNILSSS